MRSNEDPTQPKINKIKNKFNKKKSSHKSFLGQLGNLNTDRILDDAFELSLIFLRVKMTVCVRDGPSSLKTLQSV